MVDMNLVVVEVDKDVVALDIKVDVGLEALLDAVAAVVFGVLVGEGKLVAASSVTQVAERSWQITGDVWPVLCFLWPRFHLTNTIE
jgi:hypothetical protein